MNQNLKKIIGGLILIGAAFGLSAFIWALTNNKVVIGYNLGYQPEQPIPFSHELHAGKYGINCKYCHASVTHSRHASVPSLNICMNCHMVVKPQSPWIQQVTEAYNSGKPIQWKKVTLLPDHVKFNHAAHIQAGKQCNECHGPVEQMSVVYQHESMAMGWCINCHRKPENKAPTTCSTCHY